MIIRMRVPIRTAERGKEMSKSGTVESTLFVPMIGRIQVQTYDLAKHPMSKPFAGETEKEKIVDTVEISAAGRNLLQSSSDTLVSSGKDSLRATRNPDGKSITVHFDDGAQIPRMIDRGYLTVNGQKIILSKEDRKKLSAANETMIQLQEAAQIKHTVQHNLAVAKQQSAVWELHFRKEQRVREIADKVANGKKVSPKELKQLLESDPQAYLTALSLRAMKEALQHGKKRRPKEDAPAKNEDAELEKLEKVATTNVSVEEPAQYQINISISGESDSPSIESISIQEITPNA